MVKTQQLSSLFKQVKSSKVQPAQNTQGIGTLNPSKITSPNNQQH